MLLPILNIQSFLELGIPEKFYANELATHLTEHHNQIKDPHKHDFYVVVLFTHGAGVHEVDFDSYEVKPGSVFLLNPGQTHFWKLSDDVEGYIFFHDDEFYDIPFTNRKIKDYPYFYSLQNSPCIYLNKTQAVEFEKKFAEVYTEFAAKNLYREHKLLLLIDLIHIELSNIYLVGYEKAILSSNHYGTILSDFEKLIDEKFREEKSPRFYADLLNISSRHLNRIAKELLGKTATELITERVFLEAKRLLLHVDITVAQVADDLGYGDYSYFSRLFKKTCGVTPSLFVAGYKKR
jgi:AraC family transcriptional activator of pobA